MTHDFTHDFTHDTRLLTHDTRHIGTLQVDESFKLILFTKHAKQLF
jgi:hypothetical protein